MRGDEARGDAHVGAHDEESQQGHRQEQQHRQAASAGGTQIMSRVRAPPLPGPIQRRRPRDLQFTQSRLTRSGGGGRLDGGLLRLHRLRLRHCHRHCQRHFVLLRGRFRSFAHRRRLLNSRSVPLALGR